MTYTSSEFSDEHNSSIILMKNKSYIYIYSIYILNIYLYLSYKYRLSRYVYICIYRYILNYLDIYLSKLGKMYIGEPYNSLKREFEYF